MIELNFTDFEVKGIHGKNIQHDSISIQKFDSGYLEYGIMTSGSEWEVYCTKEDLIKLANLILNLFKK